MRLSLILPNLDMQKPIPPTRCPYDDCHSTNLRLHQEVVKPLRDTRYQHVIAYRYQCMTCKRTFRVYPPGINSAPTSQRVKELGVALYMLGLSFRAVSHILEAMGVYLCASCVYSATKNSMKEHPELARQNVFESVKTFNSTNETKVKYHGRWLTLSLVVDNSGSGAHDMTLVLDDLEDNDAQLLAASIAPFAQARVEPAEEAVKPNEFALIPAEEQNKLEDVEEAHKPVYKAPDIAMTPSIVGD